MENNKNDKLIVVIMLLNIFKIKSQIKTYLSE